MRAAVDLHIHTVLSPCADRDMTPNNIVNMALIKGLNAIAVTDHNSARNLPAVHECGKKAGILVIPGMEIESREEVHLLCLFPSLEAAFRMQDKVYGSLPPVPNREDIFGPQLIMDSRDCVIGKEERLLITASSLSLEEVSNTVEGLGGVLIPAHVDRSSYSVLSNLGFIPESLPAGSVEVSGGCDTASLLKAYPRLEKYKLVRSSDAHSLGEILEREFFLEVEELSIGELLAALK